ncbi:MAG: hypothetical protein FWD81_05215 [Methanomassiliicoccaceae archaeon]|nr:hypothetical protein [Methanomassiliicoccaceae archaeon]
MDIPVIPLRIRWGTMTSSDVVLSGNSVVMSDDVCSYDELLASLTDVCSKDTPILVADVRGMQKRDITPGVVKRVRMKHELWMMTGVRDAGDLMDAFQSDAGKVIVPYHLTSDELLREMTELSDCCIPALFADRGAVHMRGKKNDLRSVVRTMESMNLRKVLVFDQSGDNVRTWEAASGLADTVIPFIPSGTDTDAVHRLGFGDIMVPAVSLVRNGR